MKLLSNVSIKIKVMIPIVLLAIVVLLACASSLTNSRRLLDAGVVISDDCSKSIELLMDMSLDLESMGKNMYGHCDADTTITKDSFATAINGKMEEMQGYFGEYKKQPLTDKEQEYFGAFEKKFGKYRDGMNAVLDASSKGDADKSIEAINVQQKPAAKRVQFCDNIGYSFYSSVNTCYCICTYHLFQKHCGTYAVYQQKNAENGR